MIDIKAYQPGQPLRIKRIPGETHELWTVLTVSIELRESDNLLRSHEMVQLLTILAIDEDGEDLGKEPIRINSDMYDIEEL